MDARARGQGDGRVTDQIGPRIGIEMEDLHVQLRPAAKTPRGPVDVQRMIPTADGTDPRRIQLRLSFRYALQHFPVVSLSQPTQITSIY